MRLRITLMLAVTGVLAGAVVIDRAAVIVDKHVIKLSDLQRDVRVTEFLNREPLNVNAEAIHNAAERLIDQTIIRSEIAEGNYRRPTNADVDSLLQQFRRDRFGGVDARLREALSRYGLTEEQLWQQLLWQLTVLRFIDERFRPGVQVTDEDVHSYYDQHLSELQRDNPRSYSFGALETKMRASLEGERINRDFDSWLAEARKRGHIEYKRGAFE